jgi:hypothetical protein
MAHCIGFGGPPTRVVLLRRLDEAIGRHPMTSAPHEDADHASQSELQFSRSGPRSVS